VGRRADRQFSTKPPGKQIVDLSCSPKTRPSRGHGPWWLVTPRHLGWRSAAIRVVGGCARGPDRRNRRWREKPLHECGHPSPYLAARRDIACPALLALRGIALVGLAGFFYVFIGLHRALALMAIARRRLGRGEPRRGNWRAEGPHGCLAATWHFSPDPARERPSQTRSRFCGSGAEKYPWAATTACHGGAPWIGRLALVELQGGRWAFTRCSAR